MLLRHTTAVLVLGLCVLVPHAASGQARLTVTDPTVSLPDDVAFALANPTGTPILLDSLVMRFAGGERDFEGWVLQTQAGDAPPFGCSFYRGSPFPGIPRCEPAATFAAGAVVRVEVFYKICSICRPGEAAPTSRFDGGTADTLLVYSGGSVESERVVFDASRFVALGDAPEAGVLSVSVVPNPVRSAAHVAVEFGTPAALATVGVYDVLGRRVAVLHAGPLAAGAASFTLDTSGWAAGAYIVRASADGASAQARVAVVR